MNKKQLHEIAVKAVIEANEAGKVFATLSDQFAKASEKAISAVEVACVSAYAASVAGVTGAEIARDAGVSEMTVSRYIASGKVAFQTENKVSATKVNSDLGNKYLTIGEAKNVENASQYGKLVKAGKDAKNGKSGKADKRTPLEVAQAHVEAVGKAIKSGKVSLEEVTDLWASMVAGLESSEIEEMEEVEV